MTVKIFKLREDGERMKSYRAIDRVCAMERTETGMVFTLDRWNERPRLEMDFEGREYEIEVYP